MAIGTTGYCPRIMTDLFLRDALYRLCLAQRPSNFRDRIFKEAPYHTHLQGSAVPGDRSLRPLSAVAALRMAGLGTEALFRAGTQGCI